MRPEDLKQRLGQILTEEEDPDTDWDAVAEMCAVLISKLPSAAPPVAQAYLLSVESRRSDIVFAQAQRSELLRYLRSS